MSAFTVDIVPREMQRLLVVCCLNRPLSLQTTEAQNSAGLVKNAIAFLTRPASMQKPCRGSLLQLMKGSDVFALGVRTAHETNPFDVP